MALRICDGPSYRHRANATNACAPDGPDIRGDCCLATEFGRDATQCMAGLCRAPERLSGRQQAVAKLGVRNMATLGEYLEHGGDDARYATFVESGHVIWKI